MVKLLYILLLSSTTLLQETENDTISLNNNDFEIQEVQVSARKSTSVKSRSNTIDTQTLNAGELTKAACCNLSESFETNASVDVSYADAATGAKQIKMLGLSGMYVQMLTENIPNLRGLCQSFGLQYLPGPWMNSIQISKGTASVINGYEATTGQINIEFLKPKTTDPVAVNLMLNSHLHSEFNLTSGIQVINPDSNNADISTAILAHAEYAPLQMDMNNDKFKDTPTGYNINLLNRWDIFKNNYTARILIRGLYDSHNGGQIDNLPYKIGLNTWRIEGFMKNGYVFNPETNTSIGIITAVSAHNQNNYYGNRTWDATQINAYLNAIFATNFSEQHKLTAGASVNYDDFKELLNKLDNLSRQELTAGIFAEYAYNTFEKLSMLLGIRADYSTTYNLFFTPRFNIRYSPWQFWTIRATAGLGYRSPNLMADYAVFMPSNRVAEFQISQNKNSDNKQIANQEKAVNAGVSTTFYIPIYSKELQISAEYYYTHFYSGVVADFDTDPHKVIFYNLNGLSFAHSWQIEASMEVYRGLTITAAFRQMDAKTTYNNRLREKPLQGRFKALISTSYQTPLKHWQFDLTAQFNGGGRLPDPDINNPLWKHNYDWYPQLMAQITKFWRTCSVYIGAENMTNYMQMNPIIAAENPFGNNFDASMVYAPITGWKIYAGFRWNLTKY